MHRVNCTIPLMRGQVEVLSHEGSDKWSKTPAVAKMHLLPTPRVLIEISEPPTMMSGNVLNLDGLSTIRLPGGPDMQVRTVRVQIGHKNSSLLLPVRQPLTSIDAGAKLHSVRFDVINFPTLGRYDRPALLQEGSWRIELRPHTDLREITRVANSESGYALTHEGFMSRSCGRSFSVYEAEKLLNTLHLFLSFARGGNCGITLIEGKDKSGNRVWVQWGAYSSHPWFTLPSWLDRRHNNHEELAEAFPGFVQVLREGKKGFQNRVQVALYWYLRSNESSNPYSGIVLTQAALERLSRDILSDKEWSQAKSEMRLKQALDKAGIGGGLPASCTELVNLNQGDGPKALADARNDMVHADARDVLSLDAHLEVQNLGQWYAELLLLWKFGYRGRYANRLAYAYDGVFQPELVPWAT